MGAVFDRRLQTPGHPYLVPLRGIVQSLEPVEGRKTVVYFSQGLRLSTRKTFDALESDASRAMPSSDRQTFEALVSDANLANVAIYSVDVIGRAGLGTTDNSRDIPPPRPCRSTPPHKAPATNRWTPPEWPSTGAAAVPSAAWATWTT